MATGSTDRGQWGSRFGFLMAAVGSAVGLGNMWRFPYQMAENGGAAFLALYIIMLLLVGLPIMLAEFTIGRGSGRSPVAAMGFFGGKKWKPLGLLFVIAGFFILGYYGVIAGWVLRYTGSYLVSGVVDDPGGTFEAYATGGWAIGLQIVFMLMTIGIVVGGVQRGIERAAVVLMPLLFVILLGLAIYAGFLDGAGEGYAYYFRPDFSHFLDLGVVTSAAGQAFFSLSLGMGAMLTYASYLSKRTDLSRESATIGSMDFMVAFISGLMLFPMIFALGLQGIITETGESTVGALFIALPGAFAEMGAFTGRVVGLFFFIALFVAALTSAISLLEVVTSTAIDSLGWTRRKATLVMGAAITVVGVPCAIDLNVLTIYDEIAGEVLLVLGALLIAIFVGWGMADPVGEASQGSDRPGLFPPWRVLLRYVVPPILAVVLIFQALGTWQSLSGIFTSSPEQGDAQEQVEEPPTDAASPETAPPIVDGEG